MELLKNLKYGFATTLAVFSLGAAAAQPEYVPDEVLIVPDTTFQAASVQAQGMSIQSIRNAHKGRTNFSKVKVKEGQTVEEAVRVLNNTPGIKHAEPNYIYRATAVPNDPDYVTNQYYWGLKNTGQTVNSTAGTSGVDINAEAAWTTRTDCSAVTVAVIDSGIDYNHPDLAASIWSNAGEVAGDGIDNDGNNFIDDIRGWDFVYSDNNPMDTNNHGTHVAGTIGAVGNNSYGGVGVCWTASLMPVRVLDGSGAGTTDSIISGIDYAVANGARIINMSLGGGGYSQLMNGAIADANTAGVLVVVAAGNSGTDNDTSPVYPASYDQPNIISVAATDQNDALASFSNYGKNSVDVAAPGVNIYSTIPGRVPVIGCGWNFDDGTEQGWNTSTYDTLTRTNVTDTMGVTNATSNSPSYSLTDSVGGSYANNRIYTATSPSCNLSGVTDARLEFAVNVDVEYGWDYVDVLASGGTTWSSLLGGVPITGNTGGWISGSLDLNAWNNASAFQLRWTLTTDGSNCNPYTNSCVPAYPYDGVYVDDIAVTKSISTGYTGNEYIFYQGTSMATPHVAGVAALTLAQDSTLSVPGDVSKLRTRVIESGEWLETLETKISSEKRINAYNAVSGEVISGLTATINGSQVDLSWGDINTETGYQVWRKVNSGSYSSVTSLAASAVTPIGYSDVTILPADTSYTYQVRAITPTGMVYSNTASVATLPSAPTGLTATYYSSSGYVGLVWTDNSNSETGFQIKRNNVLLTTVTSSAAVGGNVYYYDTNPGPETDYTYEVLAVNTAGSVSGGTATVTTPIAAPTGLAATAISSSQIRLSWTDNSSIETSYWVEVRDVNSSSYVSAGYAGPNSTSYTVGGLQPSTFYWLRVTAIGISSSSVSATVAGTYTQDASSGGGGGSLGSYLLLMLLPLFYRIFPISRRK